MFYALCLAAGVDFGVTKASQAGGAHIPTHHKTGCPIHRGFKR